MHCHRVHNFITKTSQKRFIHVTTNSIKPMFVMEDDIGAPVENMAMPMDSVEGLAEFATEPVKAAKEEAETEGWCKKYFRWIPTSPNLLEQAEKKVLAYVSTPYSGKFVDIGSVEHQKKCRWSSASKSEERKIWSVEFNNMKLEKESGGATPTPLVLIHGLCASLGLWALNIDTLAADRPVFAVDLLGFGRSSRPKFSHDAAEAENQHVEAIEAWRNEMKIERFVLLGHSMGGFLSAAYALKYPERVAHLVLADPWGFPKKPDNVEEILPVNKSLAFKAITVIGQRVNALSVVRATGPWGPGLIGRVRPDLVNKFEALNQDGTANVGEYIYHSNAQKPTGEEAFRTMMDFFGWAKNSMETRIRGLDLKVPLTMIYGEKTWLQHLPPETIQELRSGAVSVEVVTIPDAGHHVYADNKAMFNSIVNKVGRLADMFLSQKTN